MTCANLWIDRIIIIIILEGSAIWFVQDSNYELLNKPFVEWPPRLNIWRHEEYVFSCEYIRNP